MSHAPLPDSYEGLLSRAQRSLRLGDVEGAIALYRRLVERLGRLSNRILSRRPELRDLHRQARLELTDLLGVEGRYAEAIEVEQVLLETHPDETRRWQRDLAILRTAKGEVESGLAELRTLAEEIPDDPKGWALLGREARISGRLAESEDALDQVLEVSEKDDADALTEAHYERFLLYREMRKLDEAMAAWEEAAVQKPEVRRTVRQVYDMLTDAGRYSEALRYIARDENTLQAGFQQGVIASLTGKPAEAKQTWRQVANQDPDAFEYGHDAWVEAVLRLGDPDPALEWLQESLPKHGTPRLLVLSGIGWAMRQDAELASLLFQQAINLLRRERPPRQKLDSGDWRLLDSLVADDETKATLRPYFAVIETLWG